MRFKKEQAFKLRRQFGKISCNNSIFKMAASNKSQISKIESQIKLDSGIDEEMSEMVKSIKGQLNELTIHKKRQVKMKEVKSTGEKLKEVQAYLSYCPGCERCATLCHIEKTFLTKYCKIYK